MSETPSSPAAPALSVKRYVRVLIPAILFWAGLIAGAAYLLYERSRWSENYDRAALREWLEERRPNRKSLGELIEDYLRDSNEIKSNEIDDQLEAMMEPMRMFRSGTPLFVEMYSIRVTFPERDIKPLEWLSGDRPQQAQSGQVRKDDLLDYRARDGTRVMVTCEYRMHAFHKVQQEEALRQQWVWAIGGVAIGGSLLASFSVYFFLRRERRRELAEREASQALEHAENLRLAEQLRAQTAERSKDELVRHLLEQRLEAARQESRAAEAEKTTLEMKSQIYAGIGIMAGSYAHNIKNLLVRPNDLLSRCLEKDGLAGDQANMLHEVRSTLGTVTERLQQILKTVRRDPTKAELTQLDLNDLVRETDRTWADMSRDKWKLALRTETADEPLLIRGDLSHLQQAIENLVFNARDATFEMRNQVREAARSIDDPARRRQAIMEAAAWKGAVTIRAYRQGEHAILEVRDNGIGMTDEVRRNCMQTHFSTKRDNALFEGYSAGMGLGLSFVVMVLEHHDATMEIESEPEKGAMFRVRFKLT